MNDVIAFEDSQLIASGPLTEVAVKAKEIIDRGGSVLMLDAETSRVIEVDFRGTIADVRKRLTIPLFEPQADQPRGPGRPKLGVVAREITLLPRHWDWLATQPGGASVALRKLVEAARRTETGTGKRQAQESAYRFMSALAGNMPGFEEATRALFAGKRDAFAEQISAWPKGVQDQAKKLAERAFAAT